MDTTKKEEIKTIENSGNEDTEVYDSYFTEPPAILAEGIEGDGKTTSSPPVDAFEDIFDKAFSNSNSEPKDTEKKEELQIEDPNKEEDEPNAETVKEEEEETLQNILELKVNGVIKAIDLNNPEEKAKVIQKLQKDENYEEKMALFNQNKAKVENLNNSRAIAIAFQELYLQSNGKIAAKDYIELPYEQFIGRTETTEGDIQEWNNHKVQVQARQNALQQYAAARQMTEAKFDVIQDEFFSKHKDIENLDKWMEENVYPYHAPIFTFGKVEYPPDILEMIYFWKNRQTIFEAMLLKRNTKSAKEVKFAPEVTGKKIGKSKLPGKALDASLDKAYRTEGNDDDLAY
jgi:hypothetical protein